MGTLVELVQDQRVRALEQLAGLRRKPRVCRHRRALALVQRFEASLVVELMLIVGMKGPFVISSPVPVSAGVDRSGTSAKLRLTLPRFPRGRKDFPCQNSLGTEVVAALRAIPQTTVVAMQGYCLGGGGCLALACDLRVASSDVLFGMPEVLRGMNMSWKTVPLMVETFGPTRTKELLLTPCYVGGDRALAWGLANRIVAGGAEEVRAEALRWARQIAEEVPSLAAAMVKETIDAVVALHSSLVHMDGDQYALLQGSEEQTEALSAFLQKRKPHFSER